MQNMNRLPVHSCNLILLNIPKTVNLMELLIMSNISLLKKKNMWVDLWHIYTPFSLVVKTHICRFSPKYEHFRPLVR